MTGSNKGALARVSALSSQFAVNKTAADTSILGLGNPIEAMAAERSAASFPVRQLTNFLDGGEEATALRERLMSEIERDPLFQNVDVYDLTKDQLRERTMKKITRLVHYVVAEPEEVTYQRLSLIGVVDMGLLTRTGVHYGLFFGAIRGSATPKQFSYWISQGAAELKGVIGCFCMTELGHGSNVAGLETTATFDEGSDEFIINTPHVAATKWWIGGAAHTATVCFPLTFCILLLQIRWNLTFLLAYCLFCPTCRAWQRLWCQVVCRPTSRSYNI